MDLVANDVSLFIGQKLLKGLKCLFWSRKAKKKKKIDLINKPSDKSGRFLLFTIKTKNKWSFCSIKQEYDQPKNHPDLCNITGSMSIV